MARPAARAARALLALPALLARRVRRATPAISRWSTAPGRIVGIGDVDDPDDIALKVPGVGAGILFVNENNDGFFQGDITLYHESADCADAPLVQVFAFDLIPFIGAFANTAYFPDLPGSTRTIKSEEFDTNTCSTFITTRGLCCEDVDALEDLLVAPAVLVPLTNLGTAPFHADF